VSYDRLHTDTGLVFPLDNLSNGNEFDIEELTMLRSLSTIE